MLQALPDWVIFALVVAWALSALGAIAWLAAIHGRDQARMLAAMYWAGKGDRQRALDALEGKHHDD